MEQKFRKILLIGNSGTGKSTLAHRLATQLNYPLLGLDTVWHATDYSEAAKVQFAQLQRDFMANNPAWIIDGNYHGTMPARLAQADLVILLKTPPIISVWRVICRSIKYKLNPVSRLGMAPEFKEHFDREYFEFLKFVWQYPERERIGILPLLEQLRPDQKLMIIHNRREKEQLLKSI